MCDIIRTKEEQSPTAAAPREDVDDLIFRDEKEWLASDR